jgi:hypothetical protein
MCSAKGTKNQEDRNAQPAGTSWLNMGLFDLLDIIVTRHPRAHRCLTSSAFCAIQCGSDCSREVSSRGVVDVYAGGYLDACVEVLVRV